ncbi:MAG: hypothetical protein IJ725_00805 [Ruminococcus sp.]|nr:hypothetical protein [Ruminococcus sp.]
MNRYKRELTEIKADESFKAETISLMNNRLNSQKPRRKSRITAIGALAASLALIIGITTLLANPGGRHSFTLTAYAAESTGDEIKPEALNTKSYISVGTIKHFGATTSFVTGKLNDNDEIIEEYPEDGSTITEVQHEFVFNLNCKGDNIDTVTFDSGNGKFKLSDSNKGVTETTGKSVSYNGFEESDNYYCDTFTTKYADQIWNVEPVWDPILAGNQSDDSVYPRLYLETKFKNYEMGQAPREVQDFFNWYGDGIRPKEISNAKKKALYEAYIDYLVRDLEVSVTAKFKDGSEETQKVKFKSEFLETDTNGAQFNLKAKLV